MIFRYTVEFRRLDQCFIDMATAVVSEADRELTCMSPSSTAAVAQSKKHWPNLQNSPVQRDLKRWPGAKFHCSKSI